MKNIAIYGTLNKGITIKSIKKNDSWREIIESLNFNVTIEEIKKKITNLLASYRREKTKEKKSMGTGKGTSEIYHSHWFAYEALRFLENRNQPRKKRINTDLPLENLVSDTYNDSFTNSEEDEPSSMPDAFHDSLENNRSNPNSHGSGDMQSNDIQDIANSPSVQRGHFITPTLPKKKRRSNEESNHTALLTTAVDILKTTSGNITRGRSNSSSREETEIKSFTDHVMNKTLNYSPTTPIKVQHSIYSILMKADLGEFEHNYRPRQSFNPNITRVAPMNNLNTHSSSLSQLYSVQPGSSSLMLNSFQPLHSHDNFSQNSLNSSPSTVLSDYSSTNTPTDYSSYNTPAHSPLASSVASPYLEDYNN